MTQVIHVVHVIESAAGGSLKYVVNICQGLCQGWKHTVIYSRRHESQNLDDIFSGTDVELIEINMVRQISLRSDIRSFFALRRELKNIRPDLVHLHSSKAGALGRIAVRSLKLNALYTPHGFAFYRTDARLAKKLLYYALELIIQRMSGTDMLLGAQQEYNSSRLLVAPRRRHWISNSVRVSADMPVLRLESQIVVSVGRISSEKGIYDFVELARIMPNVRFVWVGDGPNRHDLENLIESYHLRNIEITGWQNSEGVNSWLDRARVYIQPSKWEALPLSLLEAMASGKPVVASSIVAHRNVLSHGHDGYIYEDLDTCQTYIQMLLNDYGLAVAVGRNAWAKVRHHYSMEKFLNEIAHLYCRISNSMDG